MDIFFSKAFLANFSATILDSLVQSFGLPSNFTVLSNEEFKDYKGKGTGGVGGSGDFIIIGGTGKYENISGTGFSSRQNLKGKAGMAHSMNQMSGEYTY